MSDDMPQVFMPNPDKLPNGLTFSTAVQERYRGLPKMYFDSWESFGKGTKEDVPEKPPVVQIQGASGANIRNYELWVETLKQVYDSLRDDDKGVREVVKKAADLVDKGRGLVADEINDLTSYARVNPLDAKTVSTLFAGDDPPLKPTFLPTGGGELTEDAYMMTVVASMSGRLHDLMSAVHEKMVETADLPDPGKKPPLKTTPVKLGTDSPDDPAGDPSGKGKETATPPGADVPLGANTDRTAGSTTADMPQPWNWDGAERGTTGAPAGVETAASSGKGQSSDDALAKIRDLESQATSAPAAQQSGGSNSPTSQGMSPLGYALPAVMSALANRGPMGDAMGNRYPSPVSGGRAEAVGRAPGSGANNARTAPPATGGTQAPAAAAAKPVGAEDKSAAPAKPAGQAGPARVSSGNTVTPVAATGPVDKDGRVVFTFVDGRSVRVSPVVSQALTAAVGNAATTDANKAYEHTPVKVPDGKAVDAQKDPNELMTGDVARWERRTALVVKFDEEPDMHLEVIVEGGLQRFENHMSDKAGDFGPFSGFVHPPGIEPQPVGDDGSPTVIPVAASATAPA